jgi:hypothetical protein
MEAIPLIIKGRNDEVEVGRHILAQENVGVEAKSVRICNRTGDVRLIHGSVIGEHEEWMRESECSWLERVGNERCAYARKMEGRTTSLDEDRSTLSEIP